MRFKLTVAAIVYGFSGLSGVWAQGLSSGITSPSTLAPAPKNDLFADPFNPNSPAAAVYYDPSLAKQGYDFEKPVGNTRNGTANNPVTTRFNAPVVSRGLGLRRSEVYSTDNPDSLAGQGANPAAAAVMRGREAR
ncbi:MAG: hypothetical protein ACK5NY_02290 [Burkholderiaceae bacterium]|jgi:hypothetical protein